MRLSAIPQRGNKRLAAVDPKELPVDMFAPRSGEEGDRVGHLLPVGPRFTRGQRILSGCLIFNALDAMRRQTPERDSHQSTKSAPLGFANRFEARRPALKWHAISGRRRFARGGPAYKDSRLAHASVRPDCPVVGAARQATAIASESERHDRR
jgi:hypothetical protein